MAEIAARHADRSLATTFEPTLKLTVDPPRARFSSWYEMFPRSAGDGRTHGTFADCEARLPYVVDMGFDVLYLAPIHPIGLTRRKGKNNALVASLDDCGSPWAIGGSEGGHTAVHRELGTIEDFRQLVAAARTVGIDIALDIALQCSPDHPYISEHPEWFRQRPDGTMQYAENPPKKYEDIYPFDFENEDWQGLWHEVRATFDYWIAQGVRIFRVDNPHTKPFALWEWLIGEIKQAHPDVIFLAEAFTRPKIMYRLAKLGFTQSYTYFTLAQQQSGAHRLFHRAHANGFARLFPAQPLAEHARHPARTSANRRAARVHRARRARRDARRELRHLRSGVRIAGASAARIGQRGISRLGKIPDAAMGPGRARQLGTFARAAQPHPTRQSGAAAGLATRFPADRQRSAAVLRQVDA